MKKKKFKKIEDKMIQVGINLNKLESLSRILLDSIRDPLNLKEWDAANLCAVLQEELTRTKHKFNNIEMIMKI